jgi:hypothetical protein
MREAKISMNIPKGIDNRRIVADLVQEMRLVAQVRDDEKCLALFLGISRVLHELLTDPFRASEGCVITATAASDGGTALKVDPYDGTEYHYMSE